MTDKTIPDDEVLWKLNYIRSEGYCNMHSVRCVQDVAEQLGWDDVVEWIDDEVVRSPHSFNNEVWIRTLRLAVSENEDHDVSAVKLDAGGAIFLK